MKGESMKSKAVAVFAVAAICAWLARAGTIGPGFLIDADTAASVTGTIGGTAVAQVTNIAHAVTDPAAAAGSNYAWAVAGSAYQSATGAVPGIVSNMGLAVSSTVLATNAFRMVPANDPQGLTNWWFVDGTNEVHWSVATDTNTLVVTDAGGCNPYALGTFYYPDWTNNNGWRFWPDPVYAELHDPTEGWIYGNGVIPGVLNGGGEDTPGSVYVSYGAITNVTTNATTAYVDAATASKLTPLDATNAALAVVAPYTNGATLGATALQPAATNGFVTKSVTNGLVTAAVTNGFVTKTVTNGLVTASVTNSLVATNNVMPWLVNQTVIGAFGVQNGFTIGYLYTVAGDGFTRRFTIDGSDGSTSGTHYFLPNNNDTVVRQIQTTDGDTSAMRGCPSGAASTGALATVSNATISAWTPAAITVGTVWLDWARSTAWSIAVTNASYAINASNTPAASPRTMQLLLTTPATVTPAIASARKSWRE